MSPTAPSASRTSLEPAPTLRLEVVDHLGEHAAAWDDLVGAADLVSPFLRSWWLGALDADRRPCIVLVHAADRLVGGLALQRRRLLGVEVLTVLGGGRLCPDHLDLVVAPGYEDLVVAELSRWLRRPGARVVDLDGLREDALALQLFPGERAVVAELAPYEPLPADAADYFAARGSRVRGKAGKGRRRLERTGVVFRRTADADAESALDAFEALHGVREDRQELLGHREELRRFLLAGVAAGEARIYQAELDGAIVGVLLGFTTGGRWATYQIARSLDHGARDVGTVLDVVSIEEACADGLTELDLLRGAEPYKQSFATQTRGLLRVRAAHGVRGRLLLATIRGLARTRRLLGDLVRRVRPAAGADHD